MKFIVYADIHHDEYAAKCLTLQDTLQVESQVFERARTGNFDFVLFAGDRFLKREPKDEVKVRADMNLLRNLEACVQNNSAFAYFHLTGNHDRVDNALKWHTSESLIDPFSRMSGNLVVMDLSKTYTVPGIPLAIHALPAGFTFDRAVYEFQYSDRLNIFCFHDIVQGSSSDDIGQHLFTAGISLEEIDLPEFNLIYAGDIHVPQKFNLTNAKGGYVGSVLQRTRADAGKPRGWFEIEASQVDGKWVTKTEFMPTRNFFTRIELEVNEKQSYHDLTGLIDEAWVVDQAVELKLTGSKADVDRLADESKWKNYVTVFGARSFDVVRNYQAENRPIVVDMSQTKSFLEDFSLYLDSGFADIGTLSREKLVNILGGLHD